MADFRLADMQRLAAMGEAAAKAFIAGMRPEDVLKLDACFEAWAQDGQIAPQGEHWRCWLLMAGRGFGKTRAGAEWVHGLSEPCGADGRGGGAWHCRFRHCATDRDACAR